jgi:hypothetical protein
MTFYLYQNFTDRQHCFINNFCCPGPWSPLVAPKLAEMGQILKLMHTRLSLKYSRRTADPNKDDSDLKSAGDIGGKYQLKNYLRQ